MSTIGILLGEAVVEAMESGEISEADAEQLGVYIEAFDIYRERQERYHDLWKEAGARDNAHHAKSKALRIDAELRGLGDVAPDLDDCLDLINYAAFTVRNVRAGRIDHGS